RKAKAACCRCPTACSSSVRCAAGAGRACLRRGWLPRPPAKPRAQSRHAEAARSAQLAVLAAAAVVAAEGGLLVARCLAVHAQAHPRHRTPARSRDRRIALLAALASRAGRQLSPRPL